MSRYYFPQWWCLGCQRNTRCDDTISIIHSTNLILMSLSIYSDIKTVIPTHVIVWVRDVHGNGISVGMGMSPYANNTPCLKKLCKLIFCHNFAKFLLIVKTFGIKIAERTSFSEVYSFSTSPNLCQRTTVWNADINHSVVIFSVNPLSGAHFEHNC